MRKLKKLTLILLLITTKFSWATTPTTPSALPSLTIRLAFDPPSLDWNLGDVPIHVINNLMEGLYKIDAHGKLILAQAQSLPHKIAPNLIRIQLNTNIFWSDGQPVQAQNYIDSWTRLRASSTASTYSYILSRIQNFKALSPHEIEIQCHGPCEKIENLFTHWVTFPIRKDMIEKYPNQWTQPNHLIVNGPYLLSEYKPDVRFLLEPNPFHRHKARNNIQALIIPDDTTAYRLFENGKIDFLADFSVALISESERIKLKNEKKYYTFPSTILVYLAFSFSDQTKNLISTEQRQSINQAINRNQIITGLANQHQAISTWPFQNTTTVLQQPSSDTKKTNNKIKTIDFGFFEKGTNRQLAEIIQAQLKEKKLFDLALHSHDIKSYWGILSKTPYPIFLNTYSPPVYDPHFYLELLTSKNSYNMGRYANQDFDRIVNEINLDRKNTKKLSTKIQELINSDVPAIPLYLRSYTYLVNPKLKGYIINPMTSLYLDQARLE